MLGRRIKNLRKKVGLTQKQLADKLNIAPSTVAMYEAGKRDPDTETVKMMSKIFDVTTDYLLDNESRVITQEHLTSTYDRIKEELGENVQVMFHDINSFDEGEMEQLKFAIEMIKNSKKKKTP